MDPLTISLIVSGAVNILEVLIPEIEKAANKGDITPEQQSALRTFVDSFRNPKGPAFTGPEWVPSTEAPLPVAVAPAPITPVNAPEGPAVG